jgi:DNA-binding response OmpR family regulator
MSLKVLYLEDHEFFSIDIIEYLKEAGHEVFYAKTYAEAEALIETNKTFNVSIIDVILQNGKTGIHFVSKHEDKLGKIMFLTGCIDQPTLDKLSKWNFASKRDIIWDKLDILIDSVK